MDFVLLLPGPQSMKEGLVSPAAGSSVSRQCVRDFLRFREQLGPRLCLYPGRPILSDWCTSFSFRIIKKFVLAPLDTTLKGHSSSIASCGVGWSSGLLHRFTPFAHSCFLSFHLWELISKGHLFLSILCAKFHLWVWFPRNWPKTIL